MAGKTPGELKLPYKTFIIMLCFYRQNKVSTRSLKRVQNKLEVTHFVIKFSNKMPLLVTKLAIVEKMLNLKELLVLLV